MIGVLYSTYLTDSESRIVDWNFFELIFLNDTEILSQISKTTLRNQYLAYSNIAIRLAIRFYV